MPIHDWTRVYAGIFHDFHQLWCAEMRNRLNAGLLPTDHYALLEQVAVGVEGDVITLQDREDGPTADADGGVATLAAPKTRFVAELGKFPPRRKNTVAVRHVSDDRVVAVIEIVSPGNKESNRAMQSFVDKAVDLLAKGVHLLVVDLHPPTLRDPRGIHSVMSEELAGEEFHPPEGGPLTAVAYEAGVPPKAYIKPLRVGGVLPDMPVFLRPGVHVSLPLEETYTSAYQAVPARWRRVIDGV
ncbi:MAG: DUF4058 family protein [Fimbriiglobus sp.]|jgi:hypothetical protein|nr:DUF4058 family protein [Fimbriiglobus sp.]